MQLKHAKLIVAAAEVMGVELTLHEDYSGRSMYGEITAGIVGSMGDIFKCIAFAGAELGQEDPDEVDDFVEDMNLSLDNMGREFVVY